MMSDEEKENLYNRMPRCTGDVNYTGSYDCTTWNRCRGTFSWEGNKDIEESDRKFTGIWKNGQPYEGVYEIYNYYNGYKQIEERYNGILKDFKYHKTGSWISFGNKYNGEWKNGLKHGKGKYHWANGDQYEGDWRYDNFEGVGIFISSNGNKYDGEWYEGKKHGWGIFTYKNGTVEKGLWKNNEKIK